MPVIRNEGRTEPLATIREQLADLFLKELMGERSRMGPVIFELSTDQPNRVDVIVIWEAWKNLAVELRKDIVMLAYKRFEETLKSSIHVIDPNKAVPQLVPILASIVCATWEDLTESNLLPYKIQPSVDDKEVDAEDVRLLMIEAGAIRTPFGGVQLRFPTIEMAADVRNNLMNQMPEARWSIIESSFGPIME